MEICIFKLDSLQVTPELELEKQNIPHLKPLICAYLENDGYGHGSSFTLATPFCGTPFCVKKPLSQFVL